MRRYAFSRDVKAGCFVCYGHTARWFGGNAQGVAARHHDATGHETWVDIGMSIRYGGEAAVRASGPAPKLAGKADA